MITLVSAEKAFNALPHETVLQAALRQGVQLPFSCRGGVCHTCIVRCTAGTIPERAQQGLSSELVAKNYFLPCVCQPLGDMQIDFPQPDDFFVSAQLVSREEDANGTMTLLFEPLRTLDASSANAIMVRDAHGRNHRLPLANNPHEEYYFAIQLTKDDPTRLAQEWRTHLALDATILMRVAQEDEYGSEPAPPVEDPAPNLTLWDALEQGALLHRALDDFYHQVYADPQLSPFFEGIPRQRLVEKQYSFLWQAITGEQHYMGNRPYHAHHWMVISPALFQHRENMMLNCLRVQGLAEEWVQQLQQLEARYKAEIIKDHPVPRTVGDVEVPLDGFDSLVMDVDYFCDTCNGEVLQGETVHYHRRIGKMVCQRCFNAPVALTAPSDSSE